MLGANIILTTINGIPVNIADGPGSITEQPSIDNTAFIFSMSGAFSQNINSIAQNTLRNASIWVDNKILFAGGMYEVKLNNFSDFE